MNKLPITRTEFIASMHKTLDEVKQVFDYKNTSYGKDDDPFHNFRQSAIRVFGSGTPENMFTVLLTLVDKHLVALANKGLSDKEFAERIKDVIVYSSIALGIYEEWERVKGKIIDSDIRRDNISLISSEMKNINQWISKQLNSGRTKEEISGTIIKYCGEYFTVIHVPVATCEFEENDDREVICTKQITSDRFYLKRKPYEIESNNREIVCLD